MKNKGNYFKENNELDCFFEPIKKELLFKKNKEEGFDESARVDQKINKDDDFVEE